MKKCRIGEAFPMGATVIGKQSVQFVTKINPKTETSLILYEKNSGKKEEFKFTEEYRIGNVYSMIVEDIETAKYTYNFLENGKEVWDIYGKVICGNEVWGKAQQTMVSAGIKKDDFSWEDDKFWRYPYEKSVIYQLHVRGFTKHVSSGVKKKGTFEGICEKIPYLKELGITALELLPAYEFMECERKGIDYCSRDYGKENPSATAWESSSFKINYWGFKEAFYFAPKASYSANKDPVHSFKNMVKELHKAGIELLMQFYFPQSVERAYIVDVIKYWVKEYHIDGVRLLGVKIPLSVIATQPELLNSKILYENIPVNDIYGGQYVPAYKNLASYNDGYLYAVRSFLKGDVGSLSAAFHAMTEVPLQNASIVYLTNYNTFTLKDLVSFERKHNEENGEYGKDGNNNNFSWNCGVEGPTKKKAIVAVREKQIRNAITLLMLSKGTPVIMAGDEFGNSQGGNNNPYCQDNSVSWLNWKDLEKNKSQFLFFRQMISFVKEYSFIKKSKSCVEKKNGREYPYMSFHGKEAWKLEWNASNEEAGGILYYNDNRYLYIGVNMHWEEKTLALPLLPGHHKWKVEIDTSLEETDKMTEDEKCISIPPRSIKILTAKGSREDFDESISAF